MAPRPDPGSSRLDTPRPMAPIGGRQARWTMLVTPSDPRRPSPWEVTMARVTDRRLSRRAFLGASAAGGAGLLLGGSVLPAAVHAAAADTGRERTVVRGDDPQLQALMASGQMSSLELTKAYLHRIKELNPLLGAVIETNPQAIGVAAQRDAERRRHRVRGPLHGIPVLVKDNIATARPDGHDSRLTGPGRQPRPGRCRASGGAAAGRCRHPRQGQSLRMGQFPRVPSGRFPKRLERTRRIHA